MLSKLGKYEIRRELGRGAMGIVYEGFDPFIERNVAIKTVQKSLIDKSEKDETLGRFKREAQAAGRLAHPNIVSVYEYGEDNDVAYIAMEYIVGQELKEQFDSGVTFPIKECARLMVQLLDALEYSHQRGVVHRDVKPANILITREGQVKIADFGIARIESSELTQVGTVLGTPSYMSPEQFLGKEADRRSDVYSAGVILYQFLTGTRPFGGGNMNVIMHKVLNEMPPDPTMLNREISAAMKKVIETAMAKRPEDRYQNAADFMKALKAAAEAPSAPQASPDEITVKLSKPGNTTSEDATIARATIKGFSGQDHTGLNATFDFSADDFEARLQESLKEANLRSGIREVEELPDTSLSEIKLDFDHFMPAVKMEAEKEKRPPVVQPVTRNDPGESSSLLAGLAQEAKEKQSSRQTVQQESLAKAKRVDDALNRIIQFFIPFVRHVNEVQPSIERAYRFDAKTVYSNLKWKDAAIDYRKQGISDSALLDHATFSVNLCAPGPVLLRRPWGPIDILKKELHNLRLRMMDEKEMDKKPKQAWLETQLAPDFPVQIRFQGNYQENRLDVFCRNLAEFGVTAYQLGLEGVSPAFLDGLGLFLLGRTDTLPEQLRSL